MGTGSSYCCLSVAIFFTAGGKYIKKTLRCRSVWRGSLWAVCMDPLYEAVSFSKISIFVLGLSWFPFWLSSWLVLIFNFYLWWIHWVWKRWTFTSPPANFNGFGSSDFNFIHPSAFHQTRLYIPKLLVMEACFPFSPGMHLENKDCVLCIPLLITYSSSKFPSLLHSAGFPSLAAQRKRDRIPVLSHCFYLGFILENNNIVY